MTIVPERTAPFRDTQEAFEQMREYFHRDDATFAFVDADTAMSVNAASGCVYRTHDGHACAVGCLIPDSLYDESFEQSAFANSAGHNAGCVIGSHAIAELFENVARGFVRQAQYLHDGLADLGARDGTPTHYFRTFLIRLDELARDFGLSVPGD